MNNYPSIKGAYFTRSEWFTAVWTFLLLIDTAFKVNIYFTNHIVPVASKFTIGTHYRETVNFFTNEPIRKELKKRKNEIVVKSILEDIQVVHLHWSILHHNQALGKKLYLPYIKNDLKFIIIIKFKFTFC